MEAQQEGAFQFFQVLVSALGEFFPSFGIGAAMLLRGLEQHGSVWDETLEFSTLALQLAPADASLVQN